MPDLNRSLLSEGENADTLGGLTDVTITTPEEFQGLVYNGTGWVNGYAPVVSYVRNAEANTLTTGTVVYLFGGTGDHASVKRADYTSDTTSSKTIGLVGANIATSQNGPVITRGYVDGIDLSVGYSVGDVLWLGTNGQFTTTKTTAPNHLVFIGVVVRATNNGIVYVATQNGYELDELHNVAISNTVAAGVLSYDSANSRWRNAAVTVTAAGTNGQYQINNSTALGAGSLTEAASEVTSSKPLRLPSSGTSSATQLQLGTANNGIYFTGALIAVSSSAAAIMAWNGANGNTVINSAYTLAWGSSGFSTEDIGLNRHAAGVVRVNNAGASAGQLLVGPSSATIDGQAHIVSASASRPGLRIDSAATPTAPVLDVRVNGTADSGIEVDGSTTSGHTRFLLYDVTSGALQRVLVGANDSGGSGYRVLRIANA